MKTNKQSKLWQWRLKARMGGKCEECHREYVILSVDHIIPESFLRDLGLWNEIENWEDNFRLICQTCQHYKGARFDIRNPKTLILLREIVNKV